MPILEQARLKDFAYYGTGGTCAVLYAPADVAELAGYMREIQRQGKPYLLLGGGTNSLVMDEPFPGAVLLFRSLARLEVQGERMTVGAGVENSALAQAALASGLDGAAWMYRLPGQIGGTVRMNARCYGGEISQIVTRVKAVTPAGEVVDYTDPSMFRGYKDTVFMSNGHLVAEVQVTLRPGDARLIGERMAFCEKDREGKGQFAWPSCGCVFKNDYTVGVPSGLLLETAGAKSLHQAGAVVSPYHANFVYNQGATSRDILELTLRMRELVYEAFGVWMEYEMEILGHVPEDLAWRIAERKTARFDELALKPLRERMTARR